MEMPIPVFDDQVLLENIIPISKAGALYADMCPYFEDCKSNACLTMGYCPLIELSRNLEAVLN